MRPPRLTVALLPVADRETKHSGVALRAAYRGHESGDCAGNE